MSCFHPLPAFQDGAGGAVRIGYWAGEEGRKLELPCGRCIGCLGDRRRSWALRVMHEAMLYDSNLFLTLDYAPEHLKSPSLDYRDFQLFMKRLRRVVRGVSRSPVGTFPVRYFVAGEYGTRYGRPHFHTILFNIDFADKVRFHNGTYRSSQAESLWQNGNVVIGTVTPASACYVAGYTLNKRYGAAAKDHYDDVVDCSTGEITSRRPEFCQMSRDPGLGAWWYKKFRADLFAGDFAVMEGKKYKVPRYYWNKFRSEGDPNKVEEMVEARYERARVVPLSESSEERRLVREACAIARTQLFSSREF